MSDPFFTVTGTFQAKSAMLEPPPPPPMPPKPPPPPQPAAPPAAHTLDSPTTSLHPKAPQPGQQELLQTCIPAVPVVPPPPCPPFMPFAGLKPFSEKEPLVVAEPPGTPTDGVEEVPHVGGATGPMPPGIPG
jgi:hypothetical protein